MVRIVIGLVLLFPGFLAGQSLAEHFYGRQAYFEAVTEYRRLLFFSPDGWEDEALLHMAEAYGAGGRPFSAEKVLIRAITNEESSDYDIDSHILLAKLYWDDYRYQWMRNVLDGLRSMVSEEDQDRLAYVKAWTLIYQGKWSEGIELLSSCTTVPGCDQLIADLQAIVNVPQKSPVIALVYSRLVPGWGQLYAGDGAKALNAFVLVNTIRVSMVWDLVSGAYFLAGMKYFFIYLRYHRGSLRNLEGSVEGANIDALGDYLKELSSKYPEPIPMLEAMRQFPPPDE